MTEPFKTQAEIYQHLLNGGVIKRTSNDNKIKLSNGMCCRFPEMVQQIDPTILEPYLWQPYEESEPTYATSWNDMEGVQKVKITYPKNVERAVEVEILVKSDQGHWAIEKIQTLTLAFLCGWPVEVLEKKEGEL